MTLVRFVVGGVWVGSALFKVADPVASANAVRAYQILPDSLAAVTGYALPWVELSLGALLILGAFTRIAAIATALFMVLFIVGVSQAWARGIALDCGCFGGGGLVSELPVTDYLTVIGRDIAIAAASVWLALRPNTYFGLLDSKPNPRPDTEETP